MNTSHSWAVYSISTTSHPSFPNPSNFHTRYWSIKVGTILGYDNFLLWHKMLRMRMFFITFPFCLWPFKVLIIWAGFIIIFITIKIFIIRVVFTITSSFPRDPGLLKSKIKLGVFRDCSQIFSINLPTEPGRLSPIASLNIFNVRYICFSFWWFSLRNYFGGLKVGTATAGLFLFLFFWLKFAKSVELLRSTRLFTQLFPIKISLLTCSCRILSKMRRFSSKFLILCNSYSLKPPLLAGAIFR